MQSEAKQNKATKNKARRTKGLQSEATHETNTKQAHQCVIVFVLRQLRVSNMPTLICDQHAHERIQNGFCARVVP